MKEPIRDRRPTAIPSCTLLILALTACTPLPQTLDQSPRPDPPRSVTIYRDAFGVPHVDGRTDADTAFGFAYAQAEDNFWQIEENFIRAVGRAAEIYGEESFVDDWLNRGLEIERLSIEEYRSADHRLRALLDGFAEGLNAFVETHPEVKCRLLERFEPWHPLAFIRYLYYQRGCLRAARIPRVGILAELEISTGKKPKRTASRFDPRSSDVGSNSWAVTGDKSATGKALLFINPHLPFFGPSQVYEGHVLSDEGWNFSGYTRFGFPLPYVGFNEELGWASTDNAADLQDVWVETFDDPQDPTAYRYGETTRRAEEWVDTIAVRMESGLESRPTKFRKTHHGPILAVVAGQPLALRMAKFEDPGWLSQWYAMTRARNLEEFTAIVSRLDMLFGNYLYADRAGNIFYVYNAAVPIRSPQFDWTKPVDGSNPATEWRGYHSFEEIPQLLNPPSGFLQNCNGTPFLSTSDHNPRRDDFPAYMVREGDNARHREARRILASRKEFSFDDWVRLSYSTRIPTAELDIPPLLAEWQQLETRDPTSAAALREPVDLLRGWNGFSSVDSPAMTLFVVWGQEFRRARSEGRELSRLSALKRAVNELVKDWGSWRVPWGEMNRLQRRRSGETEAFQDHDPSLPIAGAPGWAGAMFTFFASPIENGKRRYGVAGNTYVAVVEFGENVKARSLHPFGASADPRSPHYFDQAPRYARGDYKEAWLTLEDVRGNAVRAYSPGASDIPTRR